MTITAPMAGSSAERRDRVTRTGARPRPAGGAGADGDGADWAGELMPSSACW